MATKLGEALSERARLQRRIGELRTRIAANAAVQEGVQPTENATELVRECADCHTKLGYLIAQINLTNAHTFVEGVDLPHGTLTDQLAARDVLAGLVNTYTQAADAATKGPESLRYMRSELALTPTLNVQELRKLADQSAQLLRELDNRIQSVNWSTDLIEL
jgi:hypothetical protein